MTGGAFLDFADVTCRRGARILFRGMSFSVGAGDALLVTGANGIGKSSLIRLAAGLLEPVEGKVSRFCPVGLLTHDLALDDTQSLAKALGFWAMLDGRGNDAATAALEAMGLAALADVPVRFLSSGQKRRAGIARVIAGDTRLWLLDEPGVGLDNASLNLLARAIARHRENGGVVVAATHMDLGLADTRVLDMGVMR